MDEPPSIKMFGNIRSLCQGPPNAVSHQDMVSECTAIKLQDPQMTAHVVFPYIFDSASAWYDEKTQPIIDIKQSLLPMICELISQGVYVPQLPVIHYLQSLMSVGVDDYWYMSDPPHQISRDVVVQANVVLNHLRYASTDFSSLLHSLSYLIAHLYSQFDAKKKDVDAEVWKNVVFLYEQMLERDLHPHDGLYEDEIERIEKTFRTKLPLRVVEYLSLFGRVLNLPKSDDYFAMVHNREQKPSRWLPLAVENQGIYTWVLDKESQSENPEVYVCTQSKYIHREDHINVDPNQLPSHHVALYPTHLSLLNWLLVGHKFRTPRMNYKEAEKERFEDPPF